MASTKQERPTMSDVGRLAGVSAQTVSRCLRGTGYVNKATRARIEAAVLTLGYRPNRIARNLHLSHTDTIGFLTSGELNYGASKTLSGLSSSAHSHDITLITTHLERDTQLAHSDVRRAVERMLSMQVDGIVVAARTDNIEQVIFETVRNEIPVVVIAGSPVSTIDSVRADSYGAGKMAVTHLIELGHRRIAYLAGQMDSDESRERERAYRDVMISNGLQPLPVLSGGDWDSSGGYAAAQLLDFSQVTAIFAGNDELALGLIAAGRERGFAPPRDYSIVGIDDMPEARFFSPPLTTVRLDFHELGRRAFDMLYERIKTKRAQAPAVLEPIMMVRESTAPCSDQQS